MYASHFNERTVLYIDERNIMTAVPIDAPRIIRKVVNINEFDITDVYDKRDCDKIEYSIHGTINEISAIRFPKIKDVSFSFVITETADEIRDGQEGPGGREADSFMAILANLVHASSPNTLAEFNKFFN